MILCEPEVEEAAIQLLQDLGYSYSHNSEIASDSPAPERAAWKDVVLEGRFRTSLARINPHLPPDALYEAAALTVLAQAEGGAAEWGEAA